MYKFPEDPREIKELCKKYNIKKYRVENGLVHVNGDVYLSGMGLDSLPVRFGKVAGDFYCKNNY
jgi:hypothetical protein